MLTEVLKEAKLISTPSKKEEKRVLEVVKNILDKVNNKLKREKISAKLIVGGSVAKGTWLPGISDIDFFLLFDYKEYAGRSAELSDIAEKILKKCFKKLSRLHGSRDYFALEKEKFYIEIVPVLKINRAELAKNITDVSPLHINWVKQRVSKKKQLISEIRLAKQFFKANQLYGAESYIRGFSGHVIEILTIYYGSFLNLIKAVSKWKEKEIIDIEKRFKKVKDVLTSLNPSKIQGPLIIVDPVESGRNAAAALDKKKFNLAIQTCKAFLKAPSIDFFKKKIVKQKDLVAKKGKRKLIILSAVPEKRKTDIAGAKLLKKFEFIKNEFEKEGFKILEADWWWDEKGPALYWFYFDPKPLSKTKIHWGPPTSMPKQFIDQFKKRWKGYKIKKSKGRYYVELKRKAVTPESFARMLIKKFKNLKLNHAS